jgi:uncharacterized membrane protein YfcA
MTHPVTWIGVALIGLGVGFLAGLFGKGGSAIATPLLHFAGVSAVLAVASPLPATIPSTLAAFSAYRREGALDRPVLRWSIAVGVPATIVGAVVTRWITGNALVDITDVVVAGLGLRFLLVRRRAAVRDDVGAGSAPGSASSADPNRLPRVIAVAAVVGLASGMLANSGGFLLAPLYLGALHLPIKKAFGSSLAVASVLAVPGTVVHAALGHVDWRIVAVFGATSIPLSFVGARVALRADAHRLERIYGAVLAALGVGFLAFAR